MPDFLTVLQSLLRWLSALAGLGTLAYSIFRALVAQTLPPGQQTGAAQRILPIPQLLIASLLFFALAYVIWRPLPIDLSLAWQLISTLLGAMIFFASVGLYLCGLYTLGENFNVASGFGVRLQQTHQLVTYGPYAWLRHPMYLAVILACWSGLLLYRTWTMLVFAIMMLGLFYRARKEDEALLQAFGKEWEDYSHRVPAWIPRFSREVRHA